MVQKQEKTESRDERDLVEEVTGLAEEVKIKALNLAINLAKSKDSARELRVLEPAFTKLINGAMDVIREVTVIVKAYCSEEAMVYESPPTTGKFDRIEQSLNDILELSRDVLGAITQIKKRPVRDPGRVRRPGGKADPAGNGDARLRSGGGTTAHGPFRRLRHRVLPRCRAHPR